MTRARDLAGFSTAIVPSSNLNVGVVTATSFVGDKSGITGGLTAGSLVVSGISTFTNLAEVRSDDGTPGRIDCYCEVSNTHRTRIQSAPHSEYSGNVTVTLPTIDGDLIVGNTTSATDQNINTSGIITSNSLITSSITGSDLAVGDVTSTGIVTAVEFDGQTELRTWLFG